MHPPTSNNFGQQAHTGRLIMGFGSVAIRSTMECQN
jgi:hypothetical protein